VQVIGGKGLDYDVYQSANTLCALCASVVN